MPIIPPDVGIHLQRPFKIGLGSKPACKTCVVRRKGASRQHKAEQHGKRALVAALLKSCSMQEGDIQQPAGV